MCFDPQSTTLRPVVPSKTQVLVDCLGRGELDFQNSVSLAHFYQNLCEPLSGRTIIITMLEDPLTYEESHERVYCSYKDRFLKRSLAPSEYKTTRSGTLYIPFHNRERLENEVACLKYIKQETDIPVPEVLDAYEENGSFLVWTARARGVPLNALDNEDRSKVFPEIHKHINTLRTLRSNTTGGPSGILCPPYMVTNHCDRNTTWQRISAKNSKYVFCHRDLSGSNIIVDPITLKITAILDWEFSGFYPEEHEIPFYQKPIPSGAQLRYFPRTVQLIKQFWEDCICLREN